MAGVTRSIEYQFKATENVTSVAGRVQRALKSARKSEGAEALEEIAKLGRGAGALVVLELLARGTEQATEQLKHFREMSATGAVSWGEYIEGIAKGVPIYGQIIKAGRDFRAEIDGTNKVVEETLQESKFVDLLRVRREQIGDLVQSRKAEEFKFLGQDLKSQLIEIKHQREIGIRAVRDALDSALSDPHVTPNQRQEIRKQAGEQSAEIERIKNVKEREAIEADRRTNQQRRFSFADKGLEFLQKEVELGKDGVAVEAGKLQIISEYAKKKQEILELLQKENISDDERKTLRGVLGQLPRQQQDAIRRFSEGVPQFSGGTATTAESYFSTGVAAAGRENNPQERAAKAAEETVKLMKEYLPKLLNNPISTPYFNAK